MNKRIIIRLFVYLSRVEHITDVFQEALLLDLRVAVEKSGMQFAGGGFSHDAFEILVPLVLTVLLRNFNLMHVVVANVRRQSG